MKDFDRFLTIVMKIQIIILIGLVMRGVYLNEVEYRKQNKPKISYAEEVGKL